MEKACKVIRVMPIDDEGLDRFGVTNADLKARKWFPKTWVELTVLQVVRDPAQVKNWLKAALDFHRLIKDSLEPFRPHRREPLEVPLERGGSPLEGNPEGPSHRGRLDAPHRKDLAGESEYLRKVPLR